MIAFTYGRPENPGDIAISAGGTIKVLTSINQELLAQKTPGRVEEIWYESSKDKRKIQGWLIQPPGFDPSKKYPIIEQVYTGHRDFLSRKHLVPRMQVGAVFNLWRSWD